MLLTFLVVRPFRLSTALAYLPMLGRLLPPIPIRAVDLEAADLIAQALVRRIHAAETN